MHSYEDITIIPILLLQKPSHTSKSKDHANHLQRRLELWHGGDIKSLLDEGRYIQKHLHSGTRQDDEAIARTFKDLMLQGKVQSALRHPSLKEHQWWCAPIGRLGSRSHW